MASDCGHDSTGEGDRKVVLRGMVVVQNDHADHVSAPERSESDRST